MRVKWSPEFCSEHTSTSCGFRRVEEELLTELLREHRYATSTLHIFLRPRDEMLRRAITLKVFRAPNFPSFRGLTTTPKPHSLIETCWADSSMLAKGVQELAGLSGKRGGSAKKPSLQALERMQATCIWEKEMIYCYAVTRSILDLYRNEFDKGNSVFSNSILCLMEMEQFDQINDVVEPATLKAYLDNWKKQNGGDGNGANLLLYRTRKSVVSAILEACYRGKNLDPRAAMLRCDQVLSAILKDSSRTGDENNLSSPLLLTSRSLRAATNLYTLRDSTIGASSDSAMERFIEDTVIRSYRRLLPTASLSKTTEDEHTFVSRGCSQEQEQEQELTTDIAVLVSCMAREEFRLGS